MRAFQDCSFSSTNELGSSISFLCIDKKLYFQFLAFIFSKRNFSRQMHIFATWNRFVIIITIIFRLFCYCITVFVAKFLCNLKNNVHYVGFWSLSLNWNQNCFLCIRELKPNFGRFGGYWRKFSKCVELNSVLSLRALECI